MPRSALQRHAAPGLPSVRALAAVGQTPVPPGGPFATPLVPRAGGEITPVIEAAYVVVSRLSFCVNDCQTHIGWQKKGASRVEGKRRRDARRRNQNAPLGWDDLGCGHRL